MFLAVGAISLWTPLADPGIAVRWLTWPQTLYLLVGTPILLPIVLGCTAYSYWIFQGIRWRWLGALSAQKGSRFSGSWACGASARSDWSATLLRFVIIL